MQRIIASLFPEPSPHMSNLPIALKSGISCQCTINRLNVNRNQLLQIPRILQLLIIELAAPLILLHDIVIRRGEHLLVISLPSHPVTLFPCPTSALHATTRHGLLVSCHGSGWTTTTNNCTKSAAATPAFTCCCHHFVFSFLINQINIIFTF